MVPRAPELVGARGFLVVAGAVGEKVSLPTPSMGENNVNGGWLQICETQVKDAFYRQISVIQLFISDYDGIHSSVFNIGISATKKSIPFLISSGKIMNFTFKMAYRIDSTKCYVYVYCGLKNSCIHYKWISLAPDHIINDNVIYVGELPEGATEITESA